MGASGEPPNRSPARLAMYCSLSGVLPEEPVVCTRSGHIYEARLVMKHVEATGREPVTGDEVTAADFLPIKSA